MAPTPPFPALLLPLVLGLALTACTQPSPPPRPSFSAPSFTDRPPIALDVARIQIEDRYAPPGRRPNVEHEFPIPPAAVAQRWAEDRLKAVGRFGVAQVAIEEAGVLSRPLPVDKGFSGLFKREAAEELVGTLRLRVTVPSEGGMRGGFAEASASARHTVLEDVSLNRRDEIYQELDRELIAELDRVLEAAIRQHLGQLVRN